MSPSAASIAPERYPSPESPGVGPAAQPMPPLPKLDTAPGDQGQGGKQDVLASLMSGIAPVKKSVDSIIAESKNIVKSGVIPGSEQIAAQIISLATQLLPMAAQNLLQPQQGAASTNSGMQMMPPPGGPAPMQ